MCDSYKEQSEGSTDSEDLIDASEQADDAASQDESDAETIEKVIRHRRGRKGGLYCLVSSAFTFVEPEKLVFIYVFHLQNTVLHTFAYWDINLFFTLLTLK